MLALVFGALVAATPLTPTDMEERTARHVLQEFERVGRRSPRWTRPSPRRRVYWRAGRSRTAPRARWRSPPSPRPSATRAAPIHPRSYVVRAAEREHALETILERKDLNQERATHLGVGVAVEGSRSALVVLLAERKAVLQRFPRVFEAPTTQGLCGEFTAPLRGAQVFVTLPDGRVERPSLTREEEASFCTRLPLARPGRYGGSRRPGRAGPGGGGALPRGGGHAAAARRGRARGGAHQRGGRARGGARAHQRVASRPGPLAAEQ
ncbi:hypothetical protein ACN28S_18200 [Cystobacter fuscus]